MKLTRNRITGLICAVLSLIYLFFAVQIPESTMPGDPGPTVFPYLSGILMLISSLTLIFRKPKEEEKKWLTKPQLLRLWGLFGMYVLYVLGLYAIGYTIPSFLILFGMSMLFSRGKNVPWWKCALYGLVLTIVIFLLFNNLLGVVLPRGRIPWLNFLNLLV